MMVRLSGSQVAVILEQAIRAGQLTVMEGNKVAVTELTPRDIRSLFDRYAGDGDNPNSIYTVEGLGNLMKMTPTK